MSAVAQPPPRLLFLDNLRYLIVLFVIFFHVSSGYSGFSEYYQETHGGGFWGGLRNFIGPIPRMPMLFFVAGFFALASLQRRGAADFWRRKGQRLVLPWVLCITFLGPIMPYLGFYSQSFNGLESGSYADFWPAFIASGFDFERWITPVVFTPNTQFHQMHFWFTSVLLQLYGLMCLAYVAWKKWGPDPAAGGGAGDATAARASFTKVMLLAALGMAALKALVGAVEPPGGTLLYFIRLDPFGMVTNGGFFALGIYARQRNWFIDGQVPGWRTALALFGMVAACGAAAAGIFFWGEEYVPQAVLVFIGSLGEALMVVFFLVLTIGLTHRYLNRPSAFNAKMAENSYYVYLVHYPVILVLRLPLLTVDWPVWLKFSLVLVGAAVISYLLSEYLIRPRRRLAAAALIGVHLLLFFVGLPRSSYSHLLLENRDRLHAAVPEQEAVRLVEAPPPGLDIWSMATPVARLSWQDGTLYFATPAQGLQALSPSGTAQVLNADLKLGSLAPLAGGGLAGVDGATNILELDGRGAVGETLVDSGAVGGTPRHLTGDGRGGLYFTVAPDQGREGAIYYRAPDGRTAVAFRPDSTVVPAGLALSADGERLFYTADGGPTVRVLRVGPDGALADPRPFAELFLADGRYGRADLERSIDPQAGDMAADAEGRLYVSSRFGLQSFAPDGALLGTVHFPVDLSWNPKWPRTCSFGGADLSVLYVTLNDEVYALQTRNPGFALPAP